MVEPQKCFTEEYVAQVVHDLKTPVLAIGGYAKRLREEKMGPLNERQKEALDTILETADRLHHDLAWIVSTRAPGGSSGRRRITNGSISETTRPGW